MDHREEQPGPAAVAADGAPETIEVRLVVNSANGLPLDRLLGVEIPATGLVMRTPGHSAFTGPRFAFYHDQNAIVLGPNRFRLRGMGGYRQRVGPPSQNALMMTRAQAAELLRYARNWRFDLLAPGTDDTLSCWAVQPAVRS